MPCPFFEPIRTLRSAELRNARLPLIDEYAGRCLSSVASSGEASGYSCNHGYALGLCVHFPEGAPNLAYRYSLVSRDSDQLNFLFVCEEGYAPAAAARLLHFSIGKNELLERDLEPAIAAQAAAFCRSFLAKHGIAHLNS